MICACWIGETFAINIGEKRPFKSLAVFILLNSISNKKI